METVPGRKASVQINEDLVYYYQGLLAEAQATIAAQQQTIDNQKNEITQLKLIIESSCAMTSSKTPTLIQTTSTEEQELDAAFYHSMFGAGKKGLMDHQRSKSPRSNELFKIVTPGNGNVLKSISAATPSTVNTSNSSCSSSTEVTPPPVGPPTPSMSLQHAQMQAAIIQQQQQQQLQLQNQQRHKMFDFSPAAKVFQSQAHSSDKVIMRAGTEENIHINTPPSQFVLTLPCDCDNVIINSNNNGDGHLQRSESESTTATAAVTTASSTPTSSSSCLTPFVSGNGMNPTRSHTPSSDSVAARRRNVTKLRNSVNDKSFDLDSNNNNVNVSSSSKPSTAASVSFDLNENNNGMTSDSLTFSRTTSGSLANTLVGANVCDFDGGGAGTEVSPYTATAAATAAGAGIPSIQRPSSFRGGRAISRQNSGREMSSADAPVGIRSRSSSNTENLTNNNSSGHYNISNESNRSSLFIAHDNPQLGNSLKELCKQLGNAVQVLLECKEDRTNDTIFVQGRCVYSGPVVPNNAASSSSGGIVRGSQCLVLSELQAVKGAINSFAMRAKDNSGSSECIKEILLSFRDPSLLHASSNSSSNSTSNAVKVPQLIDISTPEKLCSLLATCSSRVDVMLHPIASSCGNWFPYYEGARKMAPQFRSNAIGYLRLGNDMSMFGTSFLSADCGVSFIGNDDSCVGGGGQEEGGSELGNNNSLGSSEVAAARSSKAASIRAARLAKRLGQGAKSSKT